MIDARKIVLRSLAFSLVVAFLVGCVTESTGGLPGPAEDQDRVRAQLDLARGYLEQRDYNRARFPLKRALEIDPKSVEAHVLTAVLNEAQDDSELAEKHYRSALRIDPANSQALNNYGSFLYGKQRYVEAVEHLRKLVRNTDYRARSQAYENLGLAELRVGDRGAAKDAFSRALLLDRSQPRSSLELADMAYQQGDYAVAQEHYEGFRRVARQTPRSLCLGMKLGQATGDSDQLASYAMALQNLYPDSLEAKECEVPR
jgi:type IV pilus assembly protein PilF